MQSIDLTITNLEKIARMEIPFEDQKKLVNQEGSLWLGKLLNVQSELTLTQLSRKLASYIIQHPDLLKNDRMAEVLEKIKLKIQKMHGFAVHLEGILKEKTPKFSIVIGQQIFKLPVYILKQKTEYFQTLDGPIFNEHKEGQIILHQESSELEDALIHALTNEKVELNRQNILSMTVIADKYDIKKLKKQVEEWFIADALFKWPVNKDLIKEEDLLTRNGLWQIADRYNLSRVKNHLLEEVLKKFIKVLHEQNWTTIDQIREALKQESFKNTADFQIIEQMKRHGYEVHTINLRNYLVTYLFSQPLELSDLLLEICPNIKHLNLSYCDFVTDDFIKKMVEKFSDLISLDLEGCRNITEKSTEQIAKELKNLKKLNLKRNEYSPENQLIKEDFVDKIFNGLNKLKSLNVINCFDSAKNEVILTKIFDRLKNLKDFTVNNIYGEISDNLIEKFAKKITKGIFIGDLKISDKIRVQKEKIENFGYTRIEYLENQSVLFEKKRNQIEAEIAYLQRAINEKNDDLSQ